MSPPRITPDHNLKVVVNHIILGKFRAPKNLSGEGFQLFSCLLASFVVKLFFFDVMSIFIFKLCIVCVFSILVNFVAKIFFALLCCVHMYITYVHNLFLLLTHTDLHTSGQLNRAQNTSVLSPPHYLILGIEPLALLHHA